MDEGGEMSGKPVPWKDNSPFATTFYSILAGMVGAIVALAIGDHDIATDWYWPIGLLSFSLICFIWGIEKYGEAADEDSVDKYLSWLLAYNFGTGTMFLGIATYIALHYHVGRAAFLSILAAAIITSLKWWRDSLFLLFKNEESYEMYRQEQLGTRVSEPEADLLMKMHGLVRRLFNRRRTKTALPDARSFARLRPSGIHGVGVFAIRDIPKGTNIFSDDLSKMQWLKSGEIEGTSGEIRKLYDDFCVLKNGKYGCPEGFNNLTVAWYLNEPAEGQEPNVLCDQKYDFVAARDIRAGEELTVNYSTYSAKPRSKG